MVTSGNGDSYRVKRVYLDRDEAYGFAQDYKGIAPVEPVQVEKWQAGAPPSVYDGPYWRAEWWARVPVAKRRGALRHTEEGERLTTSPSARSGGPRGAARGQGGAPRIGRLPRVEVVGLSKEKVEETFWDTITQVRADLAGVPTK